MFWVYMSSHLNGMWDDVARLSVDAALLSRRPHLDTRS